MKKRTLLLSLAALLAFSAQANATTGATGGKTAAIGDTDSSLLPSVVIAVLALVP
jgi:hypothetical protein